MPIVVMLLTIAVILHQGSTRIDLWLLDGLSELKASPSSDDIVIVAIDERSLSQLGSWPWPRELHAHLLDRLHGARAVALDLIIADPSPQPESDLELARAMRRHGHVYLPIVVENAEGKPKEVAPLPALVAAANGLGTLDFERDSDGLIRRFYLHSGLGAPVWPAFATSVLGTTRKAVPPGSMATLDGWARSGERQIPYFSGKVGYPTLSYVDVLGSTGNIDAIQGKIVYVGVTVRGMGDVYRTPVSDMPGVVINAAATQGAMEGSLIKTLDADWLTWLLLCPALLWLLVHPFIRPTSVLAVGCGAALALLLCSVTAYFAFRFWLPLASLALILLVSVLVESIIDQQRFKKLALTDALTGVGNRLCFNESFRSAINMPNGRQRPIGLMILDIDNFKLYNDHFGHAAGDDVLRRVGSVLLAACPRKGLAARIGGEEFAILLPGAGKGEMNAVAESVRANLEALRIPHPANGGGIVTCSVGVACRAVGAEGNQRELFVEADEALYEAKKNGRNQVRVAGRTIVPVSPAAA